MTCIGYVIRYCKINGKSTGILIHRQIMNASTLTEVDHKNNIPTDNQRANLRFATHKQNSRNRTMMNMAASGYRGVYTSSTSKKNPWRASIKYNGKHHSLGSYKTTVEAAQAYNEAAEKTFGEFAKLNEGV